MLARCWRTWNPYAILVTIENNVKFLKKHTPKTKYINTV